MEKLCAEHLSSSSLWWGTLIFTSVYGTPVCCSPELENHDARTCRLSRDVRKSLCNAFGTAAEIFLSSAWPAAFSRRGLWAGLSAEMQGMPNLRSAPTVPLQCPYSALTVPIGKTHSALIFFIYELKTGLKLLS